MIVAAIFIMRLHAIYSRSVFIIILGCVLLTVELGLKIVSEERVGLLKWVRTDLIIVVFASISGLSQMGRASTCLQVRMSYLRPQCSHQWFPMMVC